MSIVQTLQISSISSDATEALAATLGSQLKGGEVIELVSDLGGGKTTFVRGLAKGMNSEDNVASPSFTLSREYNGKGLTLYHFDFYRLREAGIMSHELKEAIDDPAGAVVVEWADVVSGVLPVRRTTIEIKTTGDVTRELTISYPDELKYLMRELI